MENVPIQNLEVIVFEARHSPNPSDTIPVRTYYQGARSVEARLRNILNGSVTYASLERQGGASWFPSFQITSYPTIVFVDKDTSRQIARLQGAEITANNVSEILLSLDTIQRDDSGNYFHQDGRPALFNGNGNGFGLGLLNLPWWLVLLGVAYVGGRVSK